MPKVALASLPALTFGLVACGSQNWLPDGGPGTPASAVSDWDAVAELEWVDMARDANAMCGVDIEGGLWCWGSVDEEVGAGPGSGDGRPYRLLGDVDIVDVDSGAFSFCALSEQGAVYCWGANHCGKLGTGGPHESYVYPAYRFPTPTLVEVEDGVVFTQVSAGHGSTCAIDENAALWCWGADLMVDPWRFPLIPPRGNHVRPVLYDDQHTWETVSVGVEHLCGLVDGQQVRCFGSNRSGNLGDSDIPEEQTGQTMLTELEGASQTTSICALVAEEVWCWGEYAAQLSGDASQVRPVRVEFPRAVQDRALRAVGVSMRGAWHDSAEATIWGGCTRNRGLARWRP